MIIFIGSIILAALWFLFGEGKMASSSPLIISLTAFSYFALLFFKCKEPFRGWLLLYPLISLVYALIFPANSYFFPSWIIITGLSFGALFRTERGVHFKRKVDHLFDPAYQGLKRAELAQVNEALEQVLKLPQKGNVEFSVSYAIEHLQTLFEIALDRRYMIVCNQILSTLMKLSLHCLDQYPSLSLLSLRTLEKLTLNAQDRGAALIGERSVLALQEGSKVYQGEPTAPASLGSFLSEVIHVIHAIEKNAFRHNKGLSIKQLLIPFAEIKALFAEEPYYSTSELPLAEGALSEAVDAFKMLDTVLKTMPAMPSLEDVEQKAADQQTHTPASKSDEESPS